MTSKKTTSEPVVESIPSTSKRLYRSEAEKVLAGVCGGLGLYFDVDPLLFRLLFILLVIFGGSGVLLYLILWLVMPTNPQESITEDEIKQNVTDMKETAQKAVERISSPKRSGSMGGIILISLGVLFLLNNMGVVSYLRFEKIWPILLVILGFSILLRDRR